MPPWVAILSMAVVGTSWFVLGVGKRRHLGSGKLNRLLVVLNVVRYKGLGLRVENSRLEYVLSRVSSLVLVLKQERLINAHCVCGDRVDSTAGKHHGGLRGVTDGSGGGLRVGLKRQGVASLKLMGSGLVGNNLMRLGVHPPQGYCWCLIHHDLRCRINHRLGPLWNHLELWFINS